jgi:hypothetical protein
MREPPLRSRARAFLFAALASMPSAAWADPTKDQCVDADTAAQSLRRAGHLAAAREQLRTCVAQACPSLVRDDCAQRLDELQHAQPTIVFEAQDSAGHDLTAVTVRIDGRPWLDHLDGAAVPVDPGSHTLIFEAAGQEAHEQLFVIREGEKARRERVTFRSASASAPTEDGRASAPNSSGAETVPTSGNALPVAPTPQNGGASGAPPGQAQRTAGLVIGGMGIAGIVVGGISGVIAASTWNHAKDLCSPADCPQMTLGQAESDRSSALTAATVSTIGFVAGSALVVGGLALVLTAPAGSPGSLRGIRIVPVLGAGCAGVLLEGGFR